MGRRLDRGQSMTKRTRALWRDRRGATAIEYGLIAALIVMACVGAMSLLASKSITMWNNVSNTMQKNG
jgi:pilus assembly protein Flp/PilA